MAEQTPSETTLLGVLQRCRELSASSEDAEFSRTTVLEILAIIDEAIAAIESGARPNRGLPRCHCGDTKTAPFQSAECRTLFGQSDGFPVLANRK
ncbi:MAG TPA: hypothetical protein VGM05_02735 [Planctomycetaceae bacterium]